MLTLVSCQKDDGCIVGNSTIEIDEIHANDFNSINVIGDYFQVQTYSGDPYNNVTIEGESNILEALYTDVSLERLYIQTLEDICIEPGSPIKLDVYSPNITNISLTGNSYIAADSIFSEYFRIYMRGGGNIEATISTDSLVVDASLYGQIEMNGNAKTGYFNIHDDIMLNSVKLKQDSCFLTVIGSSSITVNVEKYLNVKIDGSASVYYTGEPDTIISQITGSGELIQQ